MIYLIKNVRYLKEILIKIKKLFNPFCLKFYSKKNAKHLPYILVNKHAHVHFRVYSKLKIQNLHK
jgi:hypothetical protein